MIDQLMVLTRKLQECTKPENDLADLTRNPAAWGDYKARWLSTQAPDSGLLTITEQKVYCFQND
jgi:hypothetical protein